MATSRCSRLTLLAATVIAMLVVVPVGALPPDQVVLLGAGDGKFAPVPIGAWKPFSTDPGVVRARYFETSELFLEGVAPGEAHVLLTNARLRQMRVLRVRVGESAPAPSRPAPTTLAKPCGCGAEGTYPIHCQVKDAACVAALRGLFEKADLTPRDVRVTFHIDGLQAMLRGMQAEADKAGFKGLEIHFVGANLRVRGQVGDEEARRNLLFSLYRSMLGRMHLDDQIQIGPKPR